MNKLFLLFLLLTCPLPASFYQQIPDRIAQHQPATGVYILDRGTEALMTRGWLTRQATQSLDIAYFNWAHDNVGILASHIVLQAAERGVKVRVLLDDLMIDTNPLNLLCLNAHPNVEIRIYNPQHKVGLNIRQRLFRIFTGFRQSNQRLHDKLFIADGQIAVTGGRNVADEYYDYDHEYNFRDRDILLAGPTAGEMREHFDRFWNHALARPVAELLPGLVEQITDEAVHHHRAELAAYAADPSNFAPEVSDAIADMEHGFERIFRKMVWTKVRFSQDEPGKNSGDHGLEGSGSTTEDLIAAAMNAQEEITIQTPYFILTKRAFHIFQTLLDRGIKINVSTNSIMSTDGIEAFGAYQKQRRRLLHMGINLREFKPKPEIEKKLMQRYEALKKRSPIFSLHAKSMVVDHRVLYVGSFNLDPRSAHLNTETGVFVENEQLAREVEAAIFRDMQPENSYNPATECGDRHAPFKKRLKVWFWKQFPMNPIL